MSELRVTSDLYLDPAVQECVAVFNLEDHKGNKILKEVDWPTMLQILTVLDYLKIPYRDIS